MSPAARRHAALPAPQEGIWWWTFVHYGLGSALSGVALTCFIFIMFANGKLGRWDRGCYLAASSVLPTVVVFFAFFLMFAGAADADAAAALYGPYLVLAFFVQIIPAIVSPYIYAPLLGSIMTAPVKFGLLSIVLTMAVALVVLSVLTPIYIASGSVVRILIRVVAFPLLIEMPAGAIRVASRYWLGKNFPFSRMLLALLGPVILSSVMGRFLTTNMETIGETVLVSLLLSGVELALRSTMLWRDDVYLACCGRPCGGRDASQKSRRAERWGWVSYLLFETEIEVRVQGGTREHACRTHAPPPLPRRTSPSSWRCPSRSSCASRPSLGAPPSALETSLSASSSSTSLRR